MIIDHIENLGRYAGLNEHFATAARFFQEHSPWDLPLGRTVIDGEHVFVNTAVNELSRDTMAWEAHAIYADIQLILEGQERFGWTDLCEREPLDPVRDFQVCHGEARMDFVLSPGQFVIFLPGEPHAPGNPAGLPAPCKKAVIKVRCGQ